ncbi:putative pectinesterase inhibitor domain-containing protein [Lupinus albus]|uniref:Putative pectinesterase inhibitor domain-containing protein n=1 Tax=Lupinus albus TaxID=3870 RepID=A0A6A4NSW7_LUPAL|nr:putative pectinesterase inhibitor domain-containing protein [Lupinus albus]
MNSVKVSCLLFTLSMILMSESFIPASSEKILYASVCEETKDPACIPLFKDDPKISKANNYFDLSGFILDLAVEKAKEGQNYMREIAKKYPTIDACANSFYTSTISSFMSAKVELNQDTMTANYDAKVAGDGPRYCVEALAKVKLDNPTINKIVGLLSLAAFYATNHLD